MAFVVRVTTTQKNQGIHAFDPTKKEDENDIKKEKRKKTLFDAQRSFKKNKSKTKKISKKIT